jgi:hypothetical protein
MIGTHQEDCWADMWRTLSHGMKEIRSVTSMFITHCARTELKDVSWLPDKRNIPASRYSLGSLLDTPFAGITIIGDDRCVSLHACSLIVTNGDVVDDDTYRSGSKGCIDQGRGIRRSF